MPGPSPSRDLKRVNVMMPELLHKRVFGVARKQGKSFSQWMREAAVDQLHRQKRKDVR